MLLLLFGFGNILILSLDTFQSILLLSFLVVRPHQHVAAQDIIHAISCSLLLIANDADVSPYLQVIMIENYNVTAAEHVIPAADISEQITGFQGGF